MDRIQAVREVMTLEEVAEYLQVSEKSVLRMAQSGKIPAAKVASQWRFMRSVVDDWLMAQMEIPSVRSAPARKEPPKLPPLTELMPAGGHEPGGDARHEGRGAEATGRTVARLENSPAAPPAFGKRAGAGTDGQHRDRPRDRHPASPPADLGALQGTVVGLAVCREGTDFEALDHQRTYVFFLLCAPTEDVQLRLLARVIQLGRHLAAIESIKKAVSPAVVSEILRSSEEFFEGSLR